MLFDSVRRIKEQAVAKYLNNELLKGSIVYSIGTLGSKILGIIMVPLYSYYLQKEDLGLYDLYFSISLILAPVFSLQLNEAIYRFVIDKKENITEQFVISTSSLLVLLNTILVTSALVLLSKLGSFDLSLIYPVLISVLSSLISIIQFTCRAIGQSLRYTLTGLLYIGTLFLFNILGMFFGVFDLSYLLNATIASQFCTLIYAFVAIKFWRYLSIGAISGRYSKLLLRYSLPLIPAQIIWFGFEGGSRMLIAFYLNLEINGTFAIATKFATFFVLINSVFSKAWNDHVLKVDSDNIYFDKVYRKYILFLFGCTHLLIGLSPYLLDFLVSKDYSSAMTIIPFLYLSSITSLFGVFLVPFYQKQMQNFRSFMILVVGFTINILVSVILVEYFGLYGILIGNFLGFLTILILRICDLRKKMNFKSIIPDFLLGYLTSIICIYIADRNYLTGTASLILGVLFALMYGLLLKNTKSKNISNA